MLPLELDAELLEAELEPPLVAVPPLDVPLAELAALVEPELLPPLVSEEDSELGPVVPELVPPFVEAPPDEAFPRIKPVVALPEPVPPVVAATQTFGVWPVSHMSPGEHVPPGPQ